jgi:DNA-binding MarR family transcriptional regulator
MSEEKKLETGRWLKRRDAWIRQLVSDSFVKRNGKLVGIHLAMRLSAKKPFTYPAMKTMARQLGISTRQVARGLKELEDEKYIRVQRQAGKTSYYRLDL